MELGEFRTTGKVFLNIRLAATRVNWPPKCCMFSQHFQVTNHWTLLAYVGLREMRILRWYHHRIVGFGWFWLMLAYVGLWELLVFPHIHWRRISPWKVSLRPTRNSWLQRRLIFSFCLNVGRLWIARPYYGENCHFSGISERFMGFMGIVHGIQWEICHQLGMIFGFGTRQC